MEEPGHLIDPRFGLEMLLRLALVQDRGVDPKIAPGEQIENPVPDGLRILGGMEHLIEVQAVPSELSAQRSCQLHQRTRSSLTLDQFTGHGSIVLSAPTQTI